VARRTSPLVRHCAFVRPDQDPSLYQQIDVSFAGRHDEAVVAHIAASVSRWIRVKGLSVSRLLVEIAIDQERGWSIIGTRAEADDWEQSLADVGPIAVTKFVSEVGGALLERTDAPRQFARDRLARLDPERGVSEQIAELERSMPSVLVAEARRLAAWPGVMQLAEAEEIYVLACLSVLQGNDHQFVPGQDPLSNDELMWRIQLAADGILSWDANPHPAPGSPSRGRRSENDLDGRGDPRATDPSHPLLLSPGELAERSLLVEEETASVTRGAIHHSQARDLMAAGRPFDPRGTD
jgi:hypothetical protein